MPLDTEYVQKYCSYVVNLDHKFSMKTVKTFICMDMLGYIYNMDIFITGACNIFDIETIIFTPIFVIQDLNLAPGSSELHGV